MKCQREEKKEDVKVEGRDEKKDIDMENVCTKEEHNRDIDRVHERIDKNNESILRVELAVSKIEASANGFVEIVSKLYDTVDGKDGVKDCIGKNYTKISNLFIHRNIHWVLISGLALVISWMIFK